tara:strand:- start:150 stop:581 length:432 start_codon:yes stop_codon:yes gene_type:complete
MSDLKTQPHDGSVDAFLQSVPHKTRRSDGLVLLDLFEKTTGKKPVMWGSALVGFGQYHYKYGSGREGDWPIAAFSPRKANLSLHLMGCYDGGGFDGQKLLLDQLGKHKMGASCLYINKLSDIDMSILEHIIAGSLKVMRLKYR